jgi:hypothetical protein
MKSFVVLVVIVFLAVQPAAGQTADTAALWRAVAEKVEVGSSVRLRLRDGRKLTATLVQARPDALLIQPTTRVPVPVQPVSYDSILSMERVRNGGIGAGKAAAIGVATGVGSFLAILFIFIAANSA